MQVVMGKEKPSSLATMKRRKELSRKQLHTANLPLFMQIFNKDHNKSFEHPIKYSMWFVQGGNWRS